MSEAPSSAHASDGQPALDEIADELYALRPDAFAAARDEHIRQAKSAGQQPLARELGRLRKPTQSAWLVNLLWRDQRDVMQQLLELGNELRAAYGRASGPELQRLTAMRRELEAALMQRARALAEEAGVDVSAQMEREAQETLAAALAQPEVADEVRTGRLVKPAAYAGFGTFPTSAPRHEAEEPKQTEAKQPASPPPAKTNVVELRAVQRARERREEAERRVQEARAALETAAAALADQAGAVEAAQQRHQDLRSKVDQLQEQLHDARDEAVAAERETVAAERRRDQAEKSHEAALRALERAEQSLEDSTTSS